MTRSPSEYPSQWPSKRPSRPPGPTRSIPPAEVRKRAIVAGICAVLLGSLIVSAFIRTCRGDSYWEPRDTQQHGP